MLLKNFTLPENVRQSRSEKEPKTKMTSRPFLLISLLIFLSSNLYGASNSHDDSAEKKVLLEHLKQDKAIGVSSSHHLYPSIVTIKNLKTSIKQNPKKIIKDLEELLFKKDFNGELTVKKQIFFGAVKSFRFWREILYITLGRAYYETKDYLKAIHYYKGIPKDSYLFDMASVELAWAYLKTGQIESAGKLIKISKKHSFADMSVQQQREFKLLHSFYLVTIDKFQESLDQLTDLTVTHDRSLEMLQYKVKAQAHFGIYLTKVKDSNSSFKNKIQQLEKIVQLVERVDQKNRDPGFSFLASETYWHQASIYRIEDPLKYEKQVKQFLTKANNWIAPWFEESIRKNKAQLSEEATFFSIALLWELNKHKQGVIRLKQFPSLFPQGKYLEDIYQMLGDHFFNLNNFKEALVHYRKLSSLAKEEKAAYGVYKAAWCFYNLEQKWKSLRHFERLVIFYQQNKERQEDEIKNKKGVARESKQDLLFVMAELLPYFKAVKEFKIFKLNGREIIDFKEKLGEEYQKIGKYKDAIAAWENLLNKYSKHHKSFFWLTQLSKSHLTRGEKIDISKSLNRYLPIVLKNKDNKSFTKDLPLFEKSISNIILTVHKEARKSDNLADWKAIDLLYESFAKFFPNSKEGKIWYFAAQRKEKLKQKWKAIAWYQKAAKITSYINHLDAATSTLNILNNLTENLSLRKGKDQKKERTKYLKISQESKWFIDNFPKRAEKDIAEFIYLESLYHSNSKPIAYNYLLNKFKDSSLSKNDMMATWNQYIEQNKRLYRDKSWKDLFDNANKILNQGNWLTDNNKKSLLQIYHESSFQYAFTLEEDKTNKDYNSMVKWYQLSAIEKDLDLYFNYQLSLKGWHNSLRTLLVNKQFSRFIQQLKLFHKSLAYEKKIEELNFDERTLRLNMYKMAADVHGKLHQPLKRADMLFTAANYTDEIETKQSMVWNSIIISGSYYNYKVMNNRINKMSDSYPKFFNTQNTQMTLAKLYYYNQKYETSWNYLQPLIPAKKMIESNTAALVRDLFFVTLHDDKDLNGSIKTFLGNNEQYWKKNHILLPIWSFLHVKEFKEKLAKFTDDEKELLEAKLDKIKEDTGGAPEALKARAKKIFTILNNLSASKKRIQKSFIDNNSHLPLLVGQSICQAPTLTAYSIEQLEEQKSDKIDFHQWNEFVGKIDKKIAEITKVKEKELASCQTYKESFAHMPQLDEEIKGFYFKIKLSDEDDIWDLEKKWYTGNEKRTNYEKVHNLLKIGALARAEEIISNIKNSEEITFFTALLRLANGDSWSSLPLLKQIKQSKKFKSQASLYLSAIAKKHGQEKIANKEASAIKKKNIYEWEKGLLP